MNCQLKKCRICQDERLDEVINLGDQVLTGRFPKVGEEFPKATPICLVQCANCGLVQLLDTIDSKELYENLYGYRSGLNETMRSHLAQI